MEFFSESGTRYFLSSMGVGEHGIIHCVAFQPPGKEEDIFLEIESSADRSAVLKSLIDYAQKNDLMNKIVYEIKNEKRILQGNVINANEFIKVSVKEKAEAFDKYLAAELKISLLKGEMANDLKEVKQNYKELIDVQEECLMNLKEIASTGTKKEECEASWERDISNGIMLLIRHDNYKVIQWRPMNQDEKQVTITDQE